MIRWTTPTIKCTIPSDLPYGTKYKIAVDDSGNITTTLIS